MIIPAYTHYAYRVNPVYEEFGCFCPADHNHLIGHEVKEEPMELDQMPPAKEPKIHYAILKREFSQAAYPCYCNKRKDHDLTPRTPRIDNYGNSWGGPDKGAEKVRLSERGFIKVTPQPVLLIKHETPVFALVQREFNAKVASTLKAEGKDYR